MLLITGATGNNGKPLVETLLERGASVRVLVRDPAKVADWSARGVEVATGDFDEPASLDAAMAGVERIFLLSNAAPDAPRLQGNVVAAVQRAGVRHLVKFSALGASPDAPVSLLRWHAQVERQIADSGVPYTILRPNGFMQNALGNAGSIKGAGMFAAPQGEGRVSWVDVRDITAVAANVLTEGGHEGQTYDITGPESLSNDEIAAKMTAALGRPVRYQDVPPDAYQQTMQGFGLPEFLAKGLTELSVFYAGNNAAQVTDVVQRVGKVTPRTFDAWLAENAAAFR